MFLAETQRSQRFDFVLMQGFGGIYFLSSLNFLRNRGVSLCDLCASARNKNLRNQFSLFLQYTTKKISKPINPIANVKNVCPAWISVASVFPHSSDNP